MAEQAVAVYPLVVFAASKSDAVSMAEDFKKAGLVCKVGLATDLGKAPEEFKHLVPVTIVFTNKVEHDAVLKLMRKSKPDIPFRKL